MLSNARPGSNQSAVGAVVAREESLCNNVNALRVFVYDAARPCNIPGMSPAAGPRLTGLQRQVLYFYRRVIRTAKTLPQPVRGETLQYARSEFERYREVDKKNYQLVEHLMRKGGRQLELAKDKNVSGISFRQLRKSA
ncbi:hypothetical protein WJX84_006370 [Apatococcus fuscideae]|uniref:Complex 1 LYR protein domain-containing protein n=1 Tax=Apatococcus fuscideae TaxID=2026836 RepID=A0AAW1SZ75_9CHLO